MTNFVKILQMGAELFYADGQTYREAGRQTDGRTDRHDEANSHFPKFCERVKELRNSATTYLSLRSV